MNRFCRYPLAVLAAAGIAAGLGAQSAPAPVRASQAFTVDDALDIVSYTVGDLSADGKWVAATSASRRDGLGVDYRRDMDPTYIRPGLARLWVIDTETGKATAVFPDKRNVRGLSWSPDGSRLAMLVLRGETYEPMIYERASRRLTTVPVPAGKYVAELSDLRWTHDGKGIVFALHTTVWKRQTRERFATMTTGPVVVQSSEDPFLAWDELRRRANIRSVVAYDVTTGRTRELLPEAAVATYTISPGDSIIAYTEDITKKTDYDVIFGSETKLMARPLAGGEPRTLMPTLKGATLVWAMDGLRYAYGKDGKVFVASVSDKTPRQIAGPTSDSASKAAESDTSKAARDRRAAERFTPLRYSPTGDALLLSNRQGIWLADAATGTKELLAETSDSSTGPRVTVAAWSDDGRYIYLNQSSRTKWERGLTRYDRSTKKKEELFKDGRLYSNLRISKNGRTALLSVADGNRPTDVYVADGSLRNLRALTDANPSLRSRTIGKTELLSYLDVDGKTRYGVVYYPSDYQPGTRYPTVFNIYEEFFDDSFDATTNVLTANGYVVVRPSVGFEIGFPGEAWLKGVTAAANKLIEMGVADSARLGVHGTSYGGYATNLLITQTNRFKAAINISGKVDIISFYTDSPRLGVRNIHAAEKSQDRLGATLWQQPQKYVAHSAIMFADRITTPLLLITGEQDSNVPAGNTREMFYALRRLGKTVVWVNYMNAGHGTPATNAEEFADFHRRMLSWYDKYLKGTGKSGTNVAGR